MAATVAPVAPTRTGRNDFTVSTSVFLRLLALVHLVAFVSFWTQLEGLVGPHGLLPAQPFFNAVHASLGNEAWLRLPSLCWLFGAGKFLSVLCAAGVVLSLLLFAGVAPALCLFLLWVAYLSLVGAGQTFFNFQWDALLLETTLLAIWLAPWSLLPWWHRAAPPRLARWLLGWLLFRLMFLSGFVKLASGDPTWRDLSALTFHYETQPLPTPLAWYVHQLPAWFHRASCAGMFAVELVVPFFLFAPRALRHNAALLLIAFMAAIALTGNYTYFNFLAVALCLLALDDAWWASASRPIAARFSPRAIPAPPPPSPPPRPSLSPSPSVAFQSFPRGCQLLVDNLAGPTRWVRVAPRWSLGVFAAVVVPCTALQAIPSIARRPLFPAALARVDDLLGPFRSFNNYGLFAVMTNPRPELIFEGSDDGRDWQPYEFPDKPGDLARRPTWVAPFQPRLDWQLWFAALGPPSQNPWVLTFCEHLLRGTPEVLALIAKNPFPKHPPRFVRVVRYEYHFTDAATRARTGQWWRRTPLDFYLERVSLR